MLLLLLFDEILIPSSNTSNETFLKDLPPDPRDPDKSKDKLSQEPITLEEIIEIVGIEGCDGGEIETLTEELFFHLLQGITFCNTRHFARIVEFFKINKSLTSNNGNNEEEELDEDEEIEDDEIDKVGYKEKL